MTLLRLFCCGDRFAAKAVISLSGFYFYINPRSIDREQEVSFHWVARIRTVAQDLM